MAADRGPVRPGGYLWCPEARRKLSDICWSAGRVSMTGLPLRVVSEVRSWDESALEYLETSGFQQFWCADTRAFTACKRVDSRQNGMMTPRRSWAVTTSKADLGSRAGNADRRLGFPAWNLSEEIHPESDHEAEEEQRTGRRQEIWTHSHEVVRTWRDHTQSEANDRLFWITVTEF